MAAEDAPAAEGTQATRAPKHPRPQTGSAGIPLLPLASLVGRTAEVAAVGALLGSPAVHLLTLTGPGGTGKTRLALHLTAEVLDQFPDGTFFVELDAVEQASLVPAAIASALRVEETPGQLLLETLKREIARRRILLVLDNFEHVLNAAPVLAELLGACPHMKVLATNREALRISGEREFPVPPLAVPDLDAVAGGQLDPKALGLCESVVLFVERALAARPDFALTRDTAPAVAEICVRLDGLPLAIELAVARVKVLSPQELNRRLAENQLRLLTGGTRDLPPRQQTLRATIDWSYGLLDPAEQALHRRLAVFTGGATLEAAEAVCNLNRTLPLDVLDGLTSLVNKSLVRQREDATGQSRFAMLQTIREYALERLEASGEVGAVRQRHLEYFLALAQERPTSGAAFPAWYAHLERERDNLRAALGWAVDQGDAELPHGVAGQALRLASALTDYWRQQGRLNEGCRWLELALTRCRESPPEVRLWALHGAGLLAHLQGDNTAAAWWEEGLALARAHGDTMATAWMLNGLAGLARSRGDLDAAQVHWEESLALCRVLGNRGGSAHALTGLASVARRRGDLAAARALYGESLTLLQGAGLGTDSALVLNELGAVAFDQGDFAAAQARWEEALAVARQADYREGVSAALLRLGYLRVVQGDAASGRPRIEEGLAICEQVGNRWETAKGLGFLGDAALLGGDQAGARAHYEESLALCRDLGDRTGEASALADLGNLAHDAGDVMAAAARYRESLDIRHELGDRIGIAESLEDLAGLAAAEGLSVDAFQLAGAAASLRDATGAQPTPVARERLQRQLANVRQALGHWSSAEAAGRALSSGAACAAALAVAVGLGRNGAAEAAVGPDTAASAAVAATAPLPTLKHASREPGAWPAVPDLTPREREVALLLARGLSNREIADQLVITEKTAATHVDRILGKLRLRRRGQVAAWLQEHVPNAAKPGTSA